ncbi:MAG TPA: DUF1353 domain-containing protein [Intrasporangium sp.]|uniref:DUF1353 domain-containing protein n=1 Tax=Intrasporangium sp. TaxID=1925024 RepID=UPI002D794D5F|nr:DUF1353 domain-containing protein [Intrasporangium sp.]HET7398185.1 DUF1353 domain-containing protein [Intrasporangium sp.]
MPFVDIGPGPDDVAGTAKTEVTLTQLPPGGGSRTCFRCEDWFGWVDELGQVPPADRRVARGAETDLASIPPFLWGLFSSYGRHTMPAILHDVQCDAAKAARRGPGGAPLRAHRRREADDLFRRTLAEHAQLGIMTRWIMWSGVRLFGSLWVGVSVVLGVAVGLLHWSAPVIDAVDDVLSHVATEPWLAFLGWVPSGFAWVLRQLSERLAADQPFGSILLAVGGLTLVLVLLRSVERASPTSPSRWSPQAFGSLLGACAVAVLVLPPMVPLVLVTVVTRLLLWILDLVLHVTWTHVLRMVPQAWRPARRLPRKAPPFPGGFPKP